MLRIVRGVAGNRGCGLPIAVLATAMSLMAAAAGAESTGGYPDKAVRVIVPFAPAGPTDIVARLVTTRLAARLGKQFYVENVAGAGGNTGIGQAAHAPGDGYTVLFVSSSYVVNPSLYPKIPYDPFKDFAAVTEVGASPNVLLVNPTVPARTVADLVAFIGANPGTLSYGSAGTGTTPHLSGELFRLTGKLDIVHVPFSGAGPAVQALAGGHTPIAFVALPPAIPMIQDGTVRALAVTSARRVAAVPAVPTLAEAGVPDQEADTLQGVLVPAATPRPIVDLLYREIAAVVAEPDIKARFAELGLDPLASSPEEFSAEIRREITRWGRVIHDASIRIE